MKKNHTENIYERTPIIIGENDSLSKIAERIVEKSTVLDIGCAVGLLGKYLSEEKSCIIDGIENNKKAAQIAKKYYRTVHEIDLEENTCSTFLKNAKYNYIVLADVLEHLKSPEKILQELENFLEEDGRIIISIPNMAHVGALTEILSGDFIYRKDGLFDSTHIRFFTLKSFNRLLGENKLFGKVVDKTTREIQQTEFSYLANSSTYKAALGAFLELPDCLTYQFIIEAVPNRKRELLESTNEYNKQAGPFFHAKIYYGKSKESINVENYIMKYGDERQKLSFSLIDKDTTFIRFDPVEHQTFFWIFKILLRNKNKVLWKWNGEPSSLTYQSNIESSNLEIYSNGSGFYSINNDPIIDLPLSVNIINEATELDIEMCIPMPEKIIEAIEEKQKLHSHALITINKNKEQINHLTQSLKETNKTNERLVNEVENIYASKSWKLTYPLRIFKKNIKGFYVLFNLVPKITQSKGGYISLFRKTLKIYRNEGLAGLGARINLLKTNNFFYPSQNPYVIDKSLGLKLKIIPFYLNHEVIVYDDTNKRAFKVAIHIHLFYRDLLGEFINRLKFLEKDFDIYVSIHEAMNEIEIASILRKNLPHAKLIIVEKVPNKGRDISPLIIQFGNRLLKYDIIGHFHTKKSPHNLAANDWLSNILDNLLGKPDNHGGRISQIFDLLLDDANIVYPEANNKILKDSSGWASNHDICKQVLQRYTTISIENYVNVEFSEGSMFWAKSNALHDFLSLPFSYNDFPSEPIPADGTLAHALERLILIFASQSNGRCYRLHNSDSLTDYIYYEEQNDYSTSISNNDIKILSYYLPQFHPIPENDAWHGMGFTEWVKVKNSNPLFEGHYQQHIPHSDIGYYLLESPETLRLQADMMRKSGIHAQIFYHYWFSGKLILQNPAKMLLDNTDINMPFCFCWANENWTKKWDGNDTEVLLEQTYSIKDACDFINYLIPFFKDHRYFRIDNRPVLFIYRPASIPDIKQYIDNWNRQCILLKIEKPYLIGVLTRGALDPTLYNMDAGVERVLHDWTNGSVPDIKSELNKYHDINGSILPYHNVAKFYMEQFDTKDFTYFRSIIPNWDNTARYKNDAFLVHGSTPYLFQEWLESLITYSRETLPEDRRLIIVNAWNEWAEGAHLEPDSRFGYAYLNSVGRAMSNLKYNEIYLLNKNSIGSSLKVQLTLSDLFLEQIKIDGELKRKMFFCFMNSSIFKKYSCSFDSNFIEAFSDVYIFDQKNTTNADVLLKFQYATLFDSVFLDKLITTFSTHKSSCVIPNPYNDNICNFKISENNSVPSYVAHESPVLLIPLSNSVNHYKNYIMCADAHCFTIYPNPSSKKIIAITTIIRFHHSASLSSLKNALFCLLAMHGFNVIPMIATQDLDDSIKDDLTNLLSSIPFSEHAKPIIYHYESPKRKGDIRSKLLNESLKLAQTRYVAFLDHDDLIMPYAYSWLHDRLIMTGKSVSFGRVYSTYFDEETGIFLKRLKVFDRPYSYDDFLLYNHIPLHSFMLDLDTLPIKDLIYYDDQKYLEDYLLTLQLFTKDNADWQSFSENKFIGDYIHYVNRQQTLSTISEVDKDLILNSPEYKLCENRINRIKELIKNRTGTD